MYSIEDNINVVYPIERGIVTDWNAMEAIWDNIVTSRNVFVKERPALLTEPPLNPKENREKMTELFFEKFESPSLYIANPAVLSLYGTGATTGLVLDSGSSVTLAVPIYEGYAISPAIGRFDFGGRDLTDYFIKLLSKRKTLSETLSLRDYFSTFAGRNSFERVKEQHCQISFDFDQDLAKDTTRSAKSYTLPDGNKTVYFFKFI